jgi:Xaa-Pro aminopeptidase
VAVTTCLDDARDRLERARAATRVAGVDALLVSPGADLFYLTGYEAVPLERLTCLVLPAEGDPRLVAPGLERAAALASPVGALGIEVVAWAETDDPYALTASLLPAGARTVAVDNHMAAEQVLALREAMPAARQTLAGTVLRELRMRKTPVEVTALREAGAAIDAVHARMGEWLRPGRSEREVGRDIADAILSAGHVRADFVIVGSGPNGASPHHGVSDRVVRPGDPVVVDIGGTMPSGYRSDSTRTYVAAGPVPDDVLTYYPVLLDAQAQQCGYVRPGVSAESVDAVGRDAIAAAGYGAAFVHRTGHGIGLETHEEPYIVAGNALVLEEGMAFSIEPGIYLEGRSGARIEDIVVCTADGVERLNTTSRELVVLPG